MSRSWHPHAHETELNQLPGAFETFLPVHLQWTPDPG